MNANETDSRVDDFIQKKSGWGEELKQLRAILLSTELKETIKWGMPTYTLNGKNVVGMGAFKSYFGLWFFNGVLLEDQGNQLINAQEGKTKSLRQWRFQSKDEINPSLISEYLAEAIQIQKNLDQ
jgi:uncharacterized protein YdeI (YjbR/CyaY-like superfamily)